MPEGWSRGVAGFIFRKYGCLTDLDGEMVSNNGWDGAVLRDLLFRFDCSRRCFPNCVISLVSFRDLFDF